MKNQIKEYLRYLEQQERSAATRQQYSRDVLRFF